MSNYQKGDTVSVLDVWRDEKGSIQTKRRPGIIYDVIGEDNYLIFFYGIDRTGKVPGLSIKLDSPEGKELGLTKDSYLNLSRFKKRKKIDIYRLIGHCNDDLLEKIDEIIDKEGIKRPLN
ncbi:MAG: hypothetical protein ACJA2S_001051 [Cyclobacteriaceae bacterium]|jgi:hypothetical protein